MATQLNGVLCVPYISLKLILVYQITHYSECKAIYFSQHQLVIKDIKDPRRVSTTRFFDDITRLYGFDNFGSIISSIIFY